MSEEHEFRIYVASLSDYNSGILHGVWIDMQEMTTTDDIIDQIDTMLSESPTAAKTGIPAEEWAVHGYSGFIHLDESETPDSIWKIWEDYSQAITNDMIEQFLEYRKDIDGSASFSDIEDNYCGQYVSKEDFAESILDETGELETIPENLRYYFDYEAYARDLFMEDYSITSSGYVFRAC